MGRAGGKLLRGSGGRIGRRRARGRRRRASSDVTIDTLGPVTARDPFAGFGFSVPNERPDAGTVELSVQFPQDQPFGVRVGPADRRLGHHDDHAHAGCAPGG